MTVATVIDRRGRGVVWEQKTEPGYSTAPENYGKKLPATFKAKPIKAVLQPAKASDLQSKAEGVRTETRLIMWTRTAIRENDQIKDGATRYRIIDVDDRSHDGQYYVGYLGSLDT